MQLDIWQKVDKLIAKQKSAEAVDILSALIVDSKVDFFQPLVRMKIGNDPNDLVKWISNFERQQPFPVKSVYLEMNGFDINYDRWYIDAFGYKQFSDNLGDLEWLCDWDSEDWPEFTLVGTEPAQSVFENYHEQKIWKNDPRCEGVYDAAMLLVMCKFINYVESALASNKTLLGIQVLYTAHGFESVGLTRCHS